MTNELSCVFDKKNQFYKMKAIIGGERVEARRDDKVSEGFNDENN
jgi:hypothetical protein